MNEGRLGEINLVDKRKEEEKKGEDPRFEIALLEGKLEKLSEQLKSLSGGEGKGRGSRKRVDKSLDKEGREGILEEMRGVREKIEELEKIENIDKQIKQAENFEELKTALEENRDVLEIEESIFGLLIINIDRLVKDGGERENFDYFPEFIRSKVEELARELTEKSEDSSEESEERTVVDLLVNKGMGEMPETVKPEIGEETAEEKLKILIANLKGIAEVYGALQGRISGKTEGGGTALDVVNRIKMLIESVMENRDTDEIEEIIDNSDMGEDEKDYAKKAIEEYGIKPELVGISEEEREIYIRGIKNAENLWDLRMFLVENESDLEKELESELKKNKIDFYHLIINIDLLANNKNKVNLSKNEIESLKSIKSFGIGEKIKELDEREINPEPGSKSSETFGIDENKIEKDTERENAIDRLLNSDPQEISLKDIEDCVEKLEKTIKTIDIIKKNLKEGEELREDLKKTLEWANNRLAKAEKIRSEIVKEQSLEKEKALVIKSQEEIEGMKIEELNEEIEKVRDYLDGSFDYAKKHQEAIDKGVILVEAAVDEEEEMWREQNKKELAECTNYLKALEDAKKIQEELETSKPKIERREAPESLRESVEEIKKTVDALEDLIGEEGDKLTAKIKEGKGLSEEEIVEAEAKIKSLKRLHTLWSLTEMSTKTTRALRLDSNKEAGKRIDNIVNAHGTEIKNYEKLFDASLNKAEKSFDKELEAKPPEVQKGAKKYAEASSRSEGIIAKTKILFSKRIGKEKAKEIPKAVGDVESVGDLKEIAEKLKRRMRKENREFLGSFIEHLERFMDEGEFEGLSAELGKLNKNLEDRSEVGDTNEEALEALQSFLNRFEDFRQENIGEKIDEWIDESGLKEKVGKIEGLENLEDLDSAFISFKEGLKKMDADGKMPEEIKNIFNEMFESDEYDVGINWYISVLKGKLKEGYDNEFEDSLKKERELIASLDEQSAFGEFMKELFDGIERLGKEKFEEAETGGEDEDEIDIPTGVIIGGDNGSMEVKRTGKRPIIKEILFWINEEDMDTLKKEIEKLDSNTKLLEFPAGYAPGLAKALNESIEVLKRRKDWLSEEMDILEKITLGDIKRIGQETDFGGFGPRKS